MRQAYDYWQDQPGNLLLEPQSGSGAANPGCIQSLASRYAAGRQISPGTLYADWPSLGTCKVLFPTFNSQGKLSPSDNRRLCPSVTLTALESEFCGRSDSEVSLFLILLNSFVARCFNGPFTTPAAPDRQRRPFEPGEKEKRRRSAGAPSFPRSLYLLLPSFPVTKSVGSCSNGLWALKELG